MIFRPCFSQYLWTYIRHRKVTPTKLKILLTAFKWLNSRPCSYQSFEYFSSEMLPWCSAKSQNLFFGRSSIKTIRAAVKISIPFESCKQDLSFGGCHFSVSCLVPEILTTTWRQRHIHCGINARIEPKMTSSISHISPNISGTRKIQKS